MNRLFLISILNFISIVASAGEICNSLSDCQQLRSQTAASLAAVDAKIQSIDPSLQFSDIVKKDPTSEKFCSKVDYYTGICYMTRYNAISYCSSQGQRLPSARELAKFASRACTSSIAGKEPCGGQITEKTSSQDPFEGFLRVENDDSKFDSFAYDGFYYVRPKSEFANNQFWSSSRYISVGVPYIAHDLVMTSEGGYLRAYISSIENYKAVNRSDVAVLCVRGK